MTWDAGCLYLQRKLLPMLYPTAVSQDWSKEGKRKKMETSEPWNQMVKSRNCNGYLSVFHTHFCAIISLLKALVYVSLFFFNPTILTVSFHVAYAASIHNYLLL